MNLLSKSNQNGAPNSVAMAVTTQPTVVHIPRMLQNVARFASVHPIGIPVFPSSFNCFSACASVWFGFAAMVLLIIGCCHNALPTSIALTFKIAVVIRAIANDQACVLRL